MPYRFAVGSPGVRYSSSWRLWPQKSDVYLKQRHPTTPAKFSFHASKKCRWALLSPTRRDGGDRAIMKWERNSLAEAGSDNGVTLIRLAFPTTHLSSAFPEPSGSNLDWLQPAPLGEALGVTIFLTKESKSRLKAIFQTGERVLHYSEHMRDGCTLAVFTEHVSCGKVELSAPRPSKIDGHVFGDMLFPEDGMEDFGRPLRMLIAGDGELPPTIWELGGYQSRPL